MSTLWKDAAATPARQLTDEEIDATDHVLEVAEAWEQNDISIGQALAEGGGMNPHRARGLAFRFRRDDPRLPALERLSLAMSASDNKILPDGTMVPYDVWNASERMVASWKRSRQTYQGDDAWAA